MSEKKKNNSSNWALNWWQRAKMWWYNVAYCFNLSSVFKIHSCSLKSFAFHDFGAILNCDTSCNDAPYNQWWFLKMCCSFGSSQGEPQWHIFSQGILQQTLAMKMSLLPRDKTKASWGQSHKGFASLFFETGHSKLTCLKL